MIERQLASLGAGVTLEKFKKMKPGEQKIYLSNHPHSRYQAFFRKPTTVKSPGKVAKNKHVVGDDFDPKEVEKASEEIAENNPELEKQVEEEIESGGAPDEDEKDETPLPEDEPSDAEPEDEERRKANHKMNGRASAAGKIMMAVLGAGAIAGAGLLVPFADLVAKEFGDAFRKGEEDHHDKEMTYEEYKEKHNKTGRTLTKEEDEKMRQEYEAWLEDAPGSDGVVHQDKEKEEKESKLGKTKKFIKDTSEKAIMWVAEKHIDKLVAKYANWRRLHMLKETPEETAKREAKEKANEPDDGLPKPVEENKAEEKSIQEKIDDDTKKEEEINAKLKELSKKLDAEEDPKKQKAIEDEIDKESAELIEIGKRKDKLQAELGGGEEVKKKAATKKNKAKVKKGVATKKKATPSKKKRKTKA